MHFRGFRQSEYVRSMAELMVVDGQIGGNEMQFARAISDLMENSDTEIPRFVTDNLAIARPEERRSFLWEMALFAASNGHLTSRQAHWIRCKGHEINIPGEMVDRFLSSAKELAGSIRANPDFEVEELFLFLGGPDTMKSIDEVSDEEAVTSTLHYAAAVAAEHGGKEAVKFIKFQFGGKLGSEVAEKVVHSIENDGLTDAFDVATSYVPVMALASGVKEAAKGNYKKGASNLVACTTCKVVGSAAGAAAGAAASSIAYAGLGGTLLKAGVALGVASPPTLVVVAPIAGTVLGGYGAMRLAKKAFPGDE